MKHYADYVINSTGAPQAGASVDVYNTGTVVHPTIYSDDGITPKSNPITTDSLGKFDFYVKDGIYDLTVTNAGVVTTISHVEIVDALELNSGDTAWSVLSLTAGAFVSGGSTLGGPIILSTAVTGSQITADQNNYGGFSNVVNRISSDASRNITGATIGASGYLLILVNVGAFNIVLKNENASSTAANRFAIAADITITPNTSVMLWYDTVSSRWRAIGKAL